MLQDAKEIQMRPLNMDPATYEGLEDLVEKLAPLLQGHRLHNIVDLLSAVSDMIDMSDDAMIQKVTATTDAAIGGAWTAGNAARLAAVQASGEPVPTLLKLVRAARDEDVRRGLHFAVKFLSILGKQMRQDEQPAY